MTVSEATRVLSSLQLDKEDIIFNIVQISPNCYSFYYGYKQIQESCSITDETADAMSPEAFSELVKRLVFPIRRSLYKLEYLLNI